MLLSQLLDPTPAAVGLLGSPPLIRPRDVGGPGAWQSMVRDGALQQVRHDVAVAAGEPVTPQVRAAALAPLVPPDTYVTCASAAWVHCGGRAPQVLSVAHATGTRRPQRWAHAEVWSSAGLWAESTLIGLPGAKIRVTTPLRTAVDLALRGSETETVPFLRALAADGLDLRRAARALELRGHTRGSVRARARLAAAMS